MQDAEVTFSAQKSKKASEQSGAFLLPPSLFAIVRLCYDDDGVIHDSLSRKTGGQRDIWLLCP